MLNLPKPNVVLMVFTENKLFHFSKKALCAGTARSKWLKEALKVFGNIVFTINSLNEVFSIRDCRFCYMSKF